MSLYFAIPIILLTGYLIAKKYNTQTILFIAGILMIAIGAYFGHADFLPKGTKSSGSLFVNLFLVIKSISSSTLANLGLIIMATGGFAKYMGHIGAADVLVSISIKPLSKIRNPYLLLAFAYIFGQILNIFIPSAVGLAMLLLVALYPVLVSVGCTPVSVATVLATTACLDLGPASGASNKAAEVIGIDAASYFIHHQLLVGIVTAIVIAVLHFFTQNYFDKRDKLNNISYEFNDSKDKSLKKAPKFFAILPILPLILLLLFSKFGIQSIKIDVVTAMFISLAISMLLDWFTGRDGKKVAASLKIYLQGMGDIFASVVSLIIAAQTFVIGLNTIGFTDGLIHLSDHLGWGYSMILILMITIIGTTALLSGSGNAAFFSFSTLAPNLATNLGIPTVLLALPMQLSAGLFRSFSPVSGVVIACATVANVSPLELSKRAAIPMIGGLLTVVLMSIIMG